jgi:hypothetical protein
MIAIMRIFVYEHLCAGTNLGAASLAVEGLAMLGAVLADLTACNDVEVVTMATPRITKRLRTQAPEAKMYVVEVGQQEMLFRQLARQSEGTFVIAPEFADILAQRAEWALDEGNALLGSSPEGIRLAADKFRLAQHWQTHGIPTCQTEVYRRGTCPFPFPVVIKPRHGAGCLSTFTALSQAEYDRALARAQSEGWSGELIVQPCWSLANHLSASVSFLVGPRGRVPLAAGIQRIECAQGRFRYRGGRIPLDDRMCQTVTDVATRAIAVVPGLFGYVGVDLLINPSDPGSEIVVEINPRLTTSYVGLRKLARFNIMQAMLHVIAGNDPGPLDYHQGSVTFSSDGSVT